jgi:uncharacterized membrane protein YoaT (DUF817 family)
MLARTKTRFHRIRILLENHVSSTPTKARIWEFALFVFKQGWACLFGGILLTLILLTKKFCPTHAPIARYDFLFLCALAIQAVLLALRMETIREAKIILIFHLVGTCMELFKTSVGSWTYPEPNIIRIGHVPLFSGFMYAAVGSYLARITRILDVRYARYPNINVTVTLAVLIYANFFSHHYLPDARILLFVGVGAVFGPTWVYYRPYRKYRRMPLVLGFLLVALFIWAAENIGTFGTIWVYPHQKNGWQMVHFAKCGSWLLLMIISFILVSSVHRPKGALGLDFETWFGENSSSTPKSRAADLPTPAKSFVPVFAHWNRTSKRIKPSLRPSAPPSRPASIAASHHRGLARGYSNVFAGTVRSPDARPIVLNRCRMIKERIAVPENIAQTVQKVIQDLVAPEVKELKVIVSALQTQMDTRFETLQTQIDQRFDAQQTQIDQRFDAQQTQIDLRFDAQQTQIDLRFEVQSQKADAQYKALDQKSDTHFQALMAAFGEFRAQSELASIRIISQLSERVARLEEQRQQHH